MSLIPECRLPCPRLELRWEDVEPEHGDFYQYTVACKYNYVFPLAHLDIRAEDEEGNHGAKREHRVEICKTLSTGNAAKRIHDDKTIELPFRDGSHIQWDRRYFGNAPMYAVACGSAMLIEPRPDDRNASFLEPVDDEELTE